MSTHYSLIRFLRTPYEHCDLPFTKGERAVHRGEEIIFFIMHHYCCCCCSIHCCYYYYSTHVFAFEHVLCGRDYRPKEKLKSGKD